MKTVWNETSIRSELARLDKRTGFPPVILSSLQSLLYELHTLRCTLIVAWPGSTVNVSRTGKIGSEIIVMEDPCRANYSSVQFWGYTPISISSFVRSIFICVLLSAC